MNLLLLKNLIISPDASNLVTKAVLMLSSMKIGSIDDIYRESDAYKRGVSIGYEAEMARQGKVR